MNLVSGSEQELENSLLRATPLQMLRDARHPDWSGDEEGFLAEVGKSVFQ